MKKLESGVYEVDFGIYPRFLWIANKDSNLDGILVKCVDGEYRDAESTKKVKSDCACTVESKYGGNDGCLVYLGEKANAQVLCHESVHVADYIFETLGMCAQDYEQKNEPYAYLVDFVFGNLYGAFSTKEE